MTQWRDVATQAAQDDLDGLLNAVLPLATQLVSDSGELYPFGAAVTITGDTEMVMGHPGGLDNPLSADVMEVLTSGFRTKESELRATALVANVRANNLDAIRVDLEHREGHALRVLLPYVNERTSGEIQYLGMQASGGAH